MSRLKLLTFTLLLGVSLASTTFNFGIVWSEKTPQSVHDKLSGGLQALATQIQNALHLPYEFAFIKVKIAADGTEEWLYP